MKFYNGMGIFTEKYEVLQGVGGKKVSRVIGEDTSLN